MSTVWLNILLITIHLYKCGLNLFIFIYLISASKLKKNYCRHWSKIWNTYFVSFINKRIFLLLQVGVWQRNRKTQRLWLLWIPGCWNRSECHEESKQLRLQWPPPESRRGCRRTEQGWDERVAASTGGPNYGGTCR